MPNIVCEQSKEEVKECWKIKLLTATYSNLLLIFSTSLAAFLAFTSECLLAAKENEIPSNLTYPEQGG